LLISFDATARPAISTLSLHDALPISSVYSPGGLIDMPGGGRAPGTPGGQDVPEILRTAGPGPAPGGPVPGAQTGGRGQDRPPSGDRKSTRLNSSHVSISYAVFCLKKK